MFDLSEIRNQFPYLNLPHRSGHSLIYLDNAATTQKPLRVLDSIQNFYVRDNANIHRGMYDRATRATDGYEKARGVVQGFLSAKKASEIIFTRGATESINLVAQSFLLPRLRPGDEVVISAMEHHANLIPWQVACKQAGASLRVFPVTTDGEWDLSAAKSLLSPKTKMLAISHVSNTLGTINPIAELIRIAQKYQIPILIDAAQSVVTEEIDVQSLGCDFLVFSGHKAFGPTGIGVLYGKSKWLEEMPPYQTGGSMIRNVTFEETTYAALPQKMEAGTPNIAGAIALATAIHFITDIGKPEIKTHIHSLTETAVEKLLSIDAKLIGNPKHRSGIISFLLDDIHPHDIATILNESGIAIRAGHHCTQPLMDFYKIPGTARASFSVYNSMEEIDLLIDGLTSARKLFS